MIFLSLSTVYTAIQPNDQDAFRKTMCTALDNILTNNNS